MEIIANNVPETNWNCLDIYDLPKNLRDSEKWSCYKKFNGRYLPFADNSIDIVLFVTFYIMQMKILIIY